MRTIDKYQSQDDDFIHPLWLGILFLCIVMTIIGTLCCLRIKCSSQLRCLFNRLFGRNIETNDNNFNDERNSTISHSYNWPSIYSSTRSQSPKLYTLVNSIRRANLQKQLSLRQQNSSEEENEVEGTIDHLPQISISSSPDNARNSEIARKFYASMRNTSQCQNSVSVDSYNNDTSIASNTPSLNLDEPVKPTREKHIKLFRKPEFFKSIPDQDSLVIAL